MVNHQFYIEIVATLITLILFVSVRVIVAKIVRRFASVSERIEHRTNLVIKYIHILVNILTAIVLFTIWGIRTTQIIFFASSISAIIGVAMFAQWSILSNVTAGIILFFNFPFKIGDVIHIHDKDFPVEGEIIDITAFHALLKTKSGERVTYPNNLLMQKGITIVRQHSEDREFVD